MRMLCLALLLPSLASAQSIDLTAPDPINNKLADLRLSHNVERREAGLVLGAEALASMIGGGIVAGVLNDQALWLTFGISTMVWGAVNMIFVIGMLDIGDGAAHHIESHRNLHGEDLARLREASIRGQEQNGAVFALNLGLDVFYITAGILFFLLADQLHGSDADIMRGAALSAIPQGIFLLGYDLIGWITSGLRASRLAQVPFVRQF